jgi:hypothetical protein
MLQSRKPSSSPQARNRAGYLSDRVPVGESGGGFVLRSELKNGAIITGLGDHL